MTADQLLEGTLKLDQQLRDWGYTVTTKFECQFRAEIASNPELKKFVDDLDIPERLNMRDAFYGKAFTLNLAINLGNSLYQVRPATP